MNTCRLCLSNEGFMLSIFNEQFSQNSPSLRLKILTCADIEIFADDGLPSMICHHCIHQIEKSYQFRLKSEKSDAVLRSRIQRDIQETDNNPSFANESSQSNMKFEQPGELNGWNFSEPSSKIDIINDNLSNYNCVGCSISFESHASFIDHFKTEHPSVPVLECRTCNFPALTGLELKRHFHESHEVCYPCNACDKVFKYCKNFEDHKTYHEKNKITCKVCKQVFYTYKAHKQHESYHLDKFCKYCVKEFNSKLEYDLHIELCKKLYSCNFCEGEFEFKKDLISHILENHKNAQLSNCKHCCKTFKFYFQFQNHKCLQTSSCDSNSSQSHADDVYKCKFCSKTFPTKTSLRRHEKSHSGLKPFQCKYCPKRFKDNSTCVVHLRTHTGETPFQCQQCHKNFRQLANLKMHTFRHHKKLNTNQGTNNFDSAKTVVNSIDHSNYQLDMYDYSLEPNRIYESVPPTYDHQLTNT